MDCGPDLFSQLLHVQFGHEPSATLVLAGKPVVITKKYSLRPKLRGSAVFHTSLCLLESASEPAAAP